MKTFLLLAGLFLVGCVLLIGPAIRGPDRVTAPVAVASDVSTPGVPSWWEEETAPTGNVVSLAQRDWYKQLLTVAPGTLVQVDRDGDGDPDILALRDGLVTRVVIDDNDSMAMVDPAGDSIDDCWLIDLDSDGLLDRMIDYIDEDSDGRADKMEVRYYVAGELRWGWFWEDLDGDQLMWALDSTFLPNAGVTDMQGNNLFYANKFDIVSQAWVAIGECPFAFYDEDADGFTDECIRFCVCANASECSQDIDYGNNLAFYWGRNSSALSPTLTNVRDSLSLFPPRLAGVYSYDCGITMIGAVPYAEVSASDLSSRRRPPRATVRTSWDDARGVAGRYSASATGFSWDEAGGHQGWEGVFWTWERRILHDTGGWTAKYNVRREYDGQASDARGLYYSPVDKWIHLLGAEEGWLEVEDPTAPDKKLAEVRYFDEDGDGVFDTWEYDLDADGQVDRRPHVVQQGDPVVIPWNGADVAAAYDRWVMDGARQLATTLEHLCDAAGSLSLADPEAARIEAALSTWRGDDRARRLYERFLCEIYYVRVSERLRSVLQEWAEPRCEATDKYDEQCLRESAERWAAQCTLTEFEAAYEQGMLEQARGLLDQAVDLIVTRRQG